MRAAFMGRLSAAGRCYVLGGHFSNVEGFAVAVDEPSPEALWWAETRKGGQ